MICAFHVWCAVEENSTLASRAYHEVRGLGYELLYWSIKPVVLDHNDLPPTFVHFLMQLFHWSMNLRSRDRGRLLQYSGVSPLFGDRT